MAASVAVMNRRRKMRAIRSSPAELIEDQMVVKSLSVPPGLEALMEGLTKEVLKVQPRDICMFASDYFAKLIKLKENAGDQQYCKTTINQKTKQQRLAIKQSHHPKKEVEFINAGKLLSVPQLYLGRLKNEREAKSINNSEIKNSRSEASTAEIDKIQNGFFETANLVDKANVSANDFKLLTVEKDEESKLDVNDTDEKIGDIKIISATNGEIEETELVVLNNTEEATEEENDKQDEISIKDKESEIILTNTDENDVIIENEESDNTGVLPDDESSKNKEEITDDAKKENTINVLEDNEATTDDSIVQESGEHTIKKRSISNENISKLEVPEISTTVATPLPSDEESEIQDTAAEDDEAKAKKAAVKIQSIWRGFKVRNNRELNLPANEEKASITEKATADLINAATVIQSLWRGYSIRKINKPELEVEDKIAKESAELIEIENEIKEVQDINLVADIEKLEDKIENEIEAQEDQYLADKFEDIDELDKPEIIAEEVEKLEETSNNIEVEVVQSTDNDEITEIKETLNELEDNLVLQENNTEETSENIKEENAADATNVEIELENKEAAQEFPEITGTEIIGDSAILEGDGTEKPVTFILGADDEDLDENGDIKDHFQQKVISEDVVEDVSKIADDQINIGIEKANSTGQILELVHDDIALSPIENIDQINIISDNNEEENLKTSADNSEVEETNAIDSLEYKTEIEIADEISNDLEKLKAWITDEATDQLIENEAMKEKSLLSLNTSENELEHLDISSPHLEETHELLENEEVNEQNKLKAAEEVIMKALGLQHSGEMHDSLDVPVTNDELTIQEVVELQHSGEMHDSIDIPVHADNHEIEENYIVEEVEDEIKENFSRLKKQIGIDISEVSDDAEESAELKDEGLETVLIDETNDDEENVVEIVNDLIEEKATELEDTTQDLTDNLTNTIEDTIDTVKSAEKQLEELKEDITDKINVDIEEKAAELEDAVIDVEANLSNTLQDTSDSIENKAAHLEELKENIEDGIKEQTTELKENIEDGIEEQTTELKETITDVSDNVANTLQETEESLEGAGNQLEELKDEVKVEINETVNEFTENAADVLQETVDIVENAETQLEENVEYTIKELKEAENNLENKITEVNENIENNTQNIIEGASNEITEAYSEIVENAVDLQEDVKNIEVKVSDRINENLKALASEVENTENKINDIINENLDETSTNVENVESKIEDEIENIKDKLNENIVVENIIEETEEDKNDAKNVITTLEDLQTEDIKEVAREVIVNIENVAEEVKNDVEDVAEEAKDGIEDVAEEFKENIEEVEDNIEDVAKEVKDNIDDGAEEVNDNIENVAEEVEDNIEAVVNEVKDNIKDVAEEVKDNIEDGVEEVKDNIEDGAEEVKGNIENVAEEVEDNIEDVAEEVKDNIENVAEEVKDSIEDVAEEVPEEVKNSLKEISDEIKEVTVVQDLEDLIQADAENKDDLTNEEILETKENIVDNTELEIIEGTKEQNESTIVDLAENIENFDKSLTENLNLDSEINNINDSDNIIDIKAESNEEVVSNKLNEDEAATKIQTAWRGFNVRRTQDDKENALLSKPAECDELPHQRGEMDEEKDQDLVNKAATTIQSGLRGYLVRKRRHLLPENADSAPELISEVSNDEQNGLSKEVEQDIKKEEANIEEAEILNEEAQIEIDKTPEEAISNDEIIIEPTIVEEEIKTVDASSEIVDEISITETDNNKDDTQTDVLIETMNENQEDLPQEIKVKESLDSDDVVVSAGDISKEETSTIIDNVAQEVIDDTELLNQRLQNLTKINVYEQNESLEGEPEVPQPEDTARSSDSLNSEADNKEVEEILKSSSSSAVNLDNFDSSRYDLKSDYLTPQSKNISPMEELLSSAYKIGARLSVNDDKIVDAIDPKGDMEEKAVEYIVIPLQGPMPVVEEPIKKEYVSPRILKDEPMTVRGNDEDSPEYIYIPLKDPASTNSEILDDSIGLLHSGEMHDSLGFPHEESEDAKVGDDFKNVDKSGLLHSGEMHDSLVLPEDDVQESKDEGATVISLQHSGEIHDMIDTNIELIKNEEISDKKSDINLLSNALTTIVNENSIVQDFKETNEALDNNLELREENVLSLNENNSISEEPIIQELQIDLNTSNEGSIEIEEVENNITPDANTLKEETSNVVIEDFALSQHANLIERYDSHATEQNNGDTKIEEEISTKEEHDIKEIEMQAHNNVYIEKQNDLYENIESNTMSELSEEKIVEIDNNDETEVTNETVESVTLENDNDNEKSENNISIDKHDLNEIHETIVAIEETGVNAENEILSQIESQIDVDENKTDVSNLPTNPEEIKNEIDISNNDEGIEDNEMIPITIKEQDENTKKNEETMIIETNKDEATKEKITNNNDNELVNEIDKNEATNEEEITKKITNTENAEEETMLVVHKQDENENGTENQTEIIAENESGIDVVQIVEEENSNNNENTVETDVEEINKEQNEEINEITIDEIKSVSPKHLEVVDIINEDINNSGIVMNQNDNNLQEIEETNSVINESTDKLALPAIEEQISEEITNDGSTLIENKSIHADNEEKEVIEKEELVIKANNDELCPKENESNDVTEEESARTEEINNSESSPNETTIQVNNEETEVIDNEETEVINKEEIVIIETNNDELSPKENQSIEMTEEVQKTEEIDNESILKETIFHADNEENKEIIEEPIVVEHINSDESTINKENESEEKEKIIDEEIINEKNGNNNSEENEIINVSETLENKDNDEINEAEMNIEDTSAESAVEETEEDKHEKENNVITNIDLITEEIDNDTSQEIVLSEVNDEVTTIDNSSKDVTQSQTEHKNEDNTNVVDDEVDIKEISENADLNTTDVIEQNVEIQNSDDTKENEITLEEISHNIKSENELNLEHILPDKNENNKDDKVAVKEFVESTEQTLKETQNADDENINKIISDEATQVVIQSENEFNSKNEDKDNIEIVEVNKIDEIKEDSKDERIDDKETRVENEENKDEITVDEKVETPSIINELNTEDENVIEEIMTTDNNEEIQTEPVKTTEQNEVIVLDNIEANKEEQNNIKEIGSETNETEIIDSKDDDNVADKSFVNKAVTEEEIISVGEGDNTDDNKNVNISNEEQTEKKIIANIQEHIESNANEIDEDKNNIVIDEIKDKFIEENNQESTSITEISEEVADVNNGEVSSVLADESLEPTNVEENITIKEIIENNPNENTEQITNDNLENQQDENDNHTNDSKKLEDDDQEQEKVDEDQNDDQQGIKELQTNNLLDIENIAATKIQKTYKGYRIRRDVNKQINIESTNEINNENIVSTTDEEVQINNTNNDNVDNNNHDEKIATDFHEDVTNLEIVDECIDSEKKTNVEDANEEVSKNVDEEVSNNVDEVSKNVDEEAQSEDVSSAKEETEIKEDHQLEVNSKDDNTENENNKATKETCINNDDTSDTNESNADTVIEVSINNEEIHANVGENTEEEVDEQVQVENEVTQDTNNAQQNDSHEETIDIINSVIKNEDDLPSNIKDQKKVEVINTEQEQIINNEDDKTGLSNLDKETSLEINKDTVDNIEEQNSIDIDESKATDELKDTILEQVSNQPETTDVITNTNNDTIDEIPQTNSNIETDTTESQIQKENITEMNATPMTPRNSPIDDIDAFLERRKSSPRSASRSSNIDNPSTRQLFNEIDSLIESYGGQKRRMSPTENGKFDLESPKIASFETPKFERNLSIEDTYSINSECQMSPNLGENGSIKESDEILDHEETSSTKDDKENEEHNTETNNVNPKIEEENTEQETQNDDIIKTNDQSENLTEQAEKHEDEGTIKSDNIPESGLQNENVLKNTETEEQITNEDETYQKEQPEIKEQETKDVSMTEETINSDNLQDEASVDNIHETEEQQENGKDPVILKEHTINEETKIDDTNKTNVLENTETGEQITNENEARQTEEPEIKEQETKDEFKTENIMNNDNQKEEIVDDIHETEKQLENVTDHEVPKEHAVDEETQIDDTKIEKQTNDEPIIEIKEQTQDVEENTENDEAKTKEQDTCIPEVKEQTEQESTQDQTKIDEEQEKSEEQTINNSTTDEKQEDKTEHADTHDEFIKEEITNTEKKDKNNTNTHNLDEPKENELGHAITEENDTINTNEQHVEKQPDLLEQEAKTDDANIDKPELEEQAKTDEHLNNEKTDKDDTNTIENNGNIQEQNNLLEQHTGTEDISNKDEIEKDNKEVEEPEVNKKHEGNFELNQAIDNETQNIDNKEEHSETDDESSKKSNEANATKIEEENVNIHKLEEQKDTIEHGETNTEENKELMDNIDKEDEPVLHANVEKNPEMVKQPTDEDTKEDLIENPEKDDVSSDHEQKVRENISTQSENAKDDQKNASDLNNKTNEETVEHVEENKSITPEDKQENEEQLPAIEKKNTNNLQDIENNAATTIQNAYRGYRAKRDTTLQAQKPQERKNSTETNKTYTIEAVSSPDDISSDEDTVKNAAASKIQSSFRNYRVKRSLSLNDAPNVQTENGQVQDLKINELEDKLLASPVRVDKHHDVQTEELKDFSEITPCDVLPQNSNRNYKTRHSLDNSALNVNLDTIPEDVSDVKLDLSSVSPQPNDEEETARIEDSTTSPNSIKLETIPESIPPSSHHLNKERSLSNTHEKNVLNIKNENKTNTAGDETFHHNNSENTSCDSSMENSHSRGSIDKSSDVDQNVDHHDDFEMDSGFARDYVTDGEDAEVETSGIQSEDSIYDGDESDAKTSPDDNLEQGRRRKMDAGDYEERRIAPLEESSDINNDTLDIFLSSEELSQGAEMLTSREDLLNTSNDGHKEAKKSEEESVCCGAQSRNQRGISAPTRPDDICAHMETTANSQTTTVKCTQQNVTASPTPGITNKMGEGKEETSEQLAATKIQAGFRGYQVRKQMKTKKPSSDNKDSKRCNSGRRRNSGRAKDGQKTSDLEERSATKIQAGIRGFLVRKRQNKVKDQQA